MTNYVFFALIAFLCDLYASSRYIRSVWAGRTRPHVFSWVVCSFTAGIAAAVSFYEGAALIGLLLTVTAIFNLIIVFSSLKQGTRYVTRSDWWALGGALAAIPLWIVTKEPFAAAVCASTIAALGDIPTLRKAWHRPFEENGEMFFFFAIISLARLLATQPLTWTTAFYPGAGFVLQITVVGIVFFRRYAMRVRFPVAAVPAKK
ncbi:MAG: hypothetical protein AB7E52_04435 [Bdellovibrionales bacterium]